MPRAGAVVTLSAFFVAVACSPAPAPSISSESANRAPAGAAASESPTVSGEASAAAEEDRIHEAAPTVTVGKVYVTESDPTFECSDRKALEEIRHMPASAQSQELDTLKAEGEDCGILLKGAELTALGVEQFEVPAGLFYVVKARIMLPQTSDPWDFYVSPKDLAPKG